MAANWRSEQHPRAPQGTTIGGRFVSKLMGLRPGETTTTKHGVRIRSGRVKQGRRSRRLFSVEGGGVHRDPAAAVREADELGAPVTVGDFTGPKTHTGWLGRYRRMDLQQLEQEHSFLDQSGHDPQHVDPATLHVRTKALASALAEARGEKTKKERPGVRKKDADPVKTAKQNQSKAVKDAAARAREAITKLNSNTKDPKVGEQAKRAQAELDQLRQKADDIKLSAAEYDDLYSKMADKGKLLKSLQALDKMDVRSPQDVADAGAAVHALAQVIRRARRTGQLDRSSQIKQLEERRGAVHSEIDATRGSSMKRDQLEAEWARLEQQIYELKRSSPGARTHRPEHEIRRDLMKHRGELDSATDDYFTLRASYSKAQGLARGETEDVIGVGQHPRYAVFNRDYDPKLVALGSAELKKRVMAAEKLKKKYEQRGSKFHRELALAKKLNQDRYSAGQDARPNAEELRDALALVRDGFGEGKLDISAASTAKQITDIFDIAQSYLPKEWVDAINERKVEIAGKHGYGTGKKRALRVFVRTRARAYYSGYQHEIQMDTGSQSYSTALHELGHAVEKTNDQLRDQERLFYQKRTSPQGANRIEQLEADKQEALQNSHPVNWDFVRETDRKIDEIKQRIGKKYQKRKLSEILKGHGYESHEVAIEDEFVAPYMGKDYGGSFYELLTMGLQGVFFNEKGMYDKDQEMRNWTLGLLAAY